jgi:diacylglycerol kinase family enzyme
MSQRVEVIINAGSGSVTFDETKHLLEEQLESHGIDARIQLAQNGADIIALAKKAAQGDTEIIVAGGGDGTISGVAAIVMDAGKTLGVLPLGTLNNFSKDLEIPQDLAEAVRIIAENNVIEIDVGEVNGRIFINNSSIGLYPRIVRKRVKQQHRLGRGKWTAAFWAAWRVIRLAPLLKVRLDLGERQFRRKTPFVFVGNNEYEMDFFNIGRRTKLDDGKLSVYFLKRGGQWGLIMLIVRTLFGRLRQAKDFEEVSTEEITIETRKKRLLVAFDGEISTMRTPLYYRIRSRALKVIAPAPLVEDTNE